MVRYEREVVQYLVILMPLPNIVFLSEGHGWGTKAAGEIAVRGRMECRNSLQLENLVTHKVD